MSDLVGNPEDRFSHNEAQIIHVHMEHPLVWRKKACLVSNGPHIILIILFKGFCITCTWVIVSVKKKKIYVYGDVRIILIFSLTA